MEELDRILLEWANERIANIKQNMIDADVTVTGKTANSLEAILTDDGIMIVGAPYFSEKTEIGRTPTKNPMMFDFKSIIKKWIIDKGIESHFNIGEGLTRERDLNSVAFCIVRNITQLGSSKYRGDRPKTDVFSSEINDNIDKLTDRLSGVVIEQVFNEID